MKKILLLLAVFVALAQFPLRAQTDSDVVNFNLTLNATLDIIVQSGNDQTIEFVTSDHYNNGVWEGNGIASGVSNVTVDALIGWDMSIACPDFTGAGGTVPINNLGVWCEALGANNFSGPCACTYDDVDSPLGLTIADQSLITNDGGNIGDQTENNFNLHWRMGTQQTTYGMNPDSMFEQLFANLFQLGSYATTATLTVVAAP